MPFITPSNVFVMTMSFEHNGQGWQEKLYLDAANLTAARTLGNTILPFRILCLPQDCTIKHAKVSNANHERDGTKLDGAYPIEGGFGNADSTVLGTAANAHINNPCDCVGMRYEESSGKYATRWMHGIPDPEINQGVLVTGITTSESQTSIAYSAASTLTAWTSLVEAYWHAVRVNTRMFRKNQDGNNLVMQTSPVTRIISNGATWRRVGAVFGTKAGKSPVR